MKENLTFENINFQQDELEEEYYHCTFIGCNFSNRQIQRTDFDSCEFRTCDFTLCKFQGTIHDVKFTECRMTGIDFTEMSRFSTSLTFEQTCLDYANFVGSKMRRTIFRHCNLYEAYFDDADMHASVFDDCELTRASFSRCNLEKADFSTSYNFTINPATCRLKQTIFAESELKGLVAHLDIIIKR